MLDAISLGVSVATGIQGFFGSRRERENFWPISLLLQIFYMEREAALP